MRVFPLRLLLFSCFLFVICAVQSEYKPNILVIVLDDQDVVLNGMEPLKQVQRLVGAEGATFTNAFTTSPLCCPSRASLLTGQYAHNVQCYNNTVSGGCNSLHWRSKMEPQTIAVALQQVGYNTHFAGKYLNQYKGATVPPGWHDFHALHGNSKYYNYTLRENGRNVSYGDASADYLTDVLRERTLAFLKAHAAANGTEPFFALVAPPAPHSPYEPAKRHAGAFKNTKALRTPNFNRVPKPLEKHWLVAASSLIPPRTIATMDTYFQRRWESLLAVDELVAAIITQLELQQQLAQTYIVYTSDNGYHVGQHAQPFDKRQPYETDIRVPLLIRGPEVPPKTSVSAPVALIDLFPTFLEWAGLPAPPKDSADGLSLNAFLLNADVYEPLQDVGYRRAILIQHWGEGNEETYNDACPWQRSDNLSQCTPEADCHCQDARNNTYACIRHFRGSISEGGGIDRLYCEFHDEENFVEAYDLQDDPFQMTNLGYELLPIERAFYSLALANLTHCAGAECHDVNI